MVNVSLNTPMLFGEETFSEASKTIAEGADNGAFKLVSPDAGRDLLLGTILSAFLHILYHQPKASYLEEITELILRGLGVPNAKAQRIATQVLPQLPPYTKPFQDGGSLLHLPNA